MQPIRERHSRFEDRNGHLCVGLCKDWYQYPIGDFCHLKSTFPYIPFESAICLSDMFDKLTLILDGLLRLQ